MSVLTVSRENLENLHAHLVDATNNGSKDGQKITDYLKQGYQIQFMYKKDATDQDVIAGVLEWFIMRYEQINHIEYSMRYEEKVDFVVGMEEIKENKRPLIDKLQAERTLGSMLYNIGEYVQMSCQHQKLLEFLRELYKKCDEVRAEEMRLAQEQNMNYVD